MNKLTLARKAKGYTEDEMLKAVGISLRTYRRWEKEGHEMHDILVDKIDRLEVK